MPRRRGTSDLTQSRARELRANATAPERRLWRALRGRRLAGLKFIRQAPVQPYVVDFLCREKQLVLELDGESHAGRGAYDQAREGHLRELGLMVLRVSNDDVLRDIDAVLAAIVGAAGLDVRAWQDGALGRYEEGVL